MENTDPSTWNVDSVSGWLKNSFNLPEKTLLLVKENEIDGQVLLGHIDHGALQSVLEIKSFGQRCKILEGITQLQGRVIASTTSAGTSERRGPGFTEISEDRQQSNVTAKWDRTISLERLHLSESSASMRERVRGISACRLSKGSTRSSGSPDEEFEPLPLLDIPLRIRPPTSQEPENIDRHSLNEVFSDDESLIDESDSLSDERGWRSADSNDDSMMEWSTEDEVAVKANSQQRSTPTSLVATDSSCVLASNEDSRSSPKHATSQIATPILPQKTSSKWQSRPVTYPASDENGSDSLPASSLFTEPCKIRTAMEASVQVASDQLPSVAKEFASQDKRKQTERGKLYLSRLGLSLQEIFFGISGSDNSGENSDGSWSMVASRNSKKLTNVGHQRIVQRNVLRILRSPPIFDIPGYTVYAPMMRKDKNVPVNLISTSGGTDASAYTTDEELFREVALEENERQNIKKRPRKLQAKKRALPNSTVKTLMDDYITEVNKKWESRSQKLETKRIELYDQLTGGDQDELKLAKVASFEQELRNLSQTRLPSLTDAILETSYKTTAESRKGFGALDQTLERICYIQWILELLQGEVPTASTDASKTTESKNSDGLSKSHVQKKPFSPEEASARKERLAEEQRQKELDSDFIDDSDLYDTYEPTDDFEMETELESDKDFGGVGSKKTSSGSEESNRKSLSRPRGDHAESAHGTSDSAIKELFEAHSENLSAAHMDVEIVSLASDSDSELEYSRQDMSTDMPMSSGNISDNLSGTLSNKRPNKEDNKPRNQASRKGTSGRGGRWNRDSGKEKNNARSKGVSSEKTRPVLDHDRIGGKKDGSSKGSSTEDSLILSQESITSVAIKEIRMPNWREDYRNDELIVKELRRIRREANVGLSTTSIEPWMSVYQEYVEWMELDISSNISIKSFLYWKDTGNNTKESRIKMAEAAAALEEEDRVTAALAKTEKNTKGAVIPAKADKVAVAATPKENSGATECEDVEMESGVTEEPVRIKESAKKSGETEVLLEGVNAPIKAEEAPTSSPRCTSLSGNKKNKPSERITITIDSSDEDSSKPVPKPQLNQTRIASGKRQRAEDDGRVSPAGKSPDILSYLKRPKVTRYDYSDKLESPSSSEDEQAPKTQPETKKRIAKAMLTETEEVLQMRKNAEKNEKQLQMRIREQERRKLLLRTTTSTDQDEVLINPGHKKTEKGVKIPGFLSSNLKPHQLEGIRFLWKNIVMFDGGCILAHSMGLGKTFQVVAFLYILLREVQLRNKDIPKTLVSDEIGRVMLLLPPILLQNWEAEFAKWIPDEERSIVNILRFGVSDKTFNSRLSILRQWHNEGGVLMLSYSMFRDLCSSLKWMTESQREGMRSLLLSPGPNLTIADEGHLIKNTTAKLSLVIRQLQSKARVILTGYPLQNRLEEYWCMVDFIRPNYLGDLQTFRHNYIRPIENGLLSDSSSSERKASSKKLKVLTELIKNFVLRKDQGVLRAVLPKKVEFVISCKLSKLQYCLYEEFIDKIGEGSGEILASGHALLTICNHPAAYKAAMKRAQDMLKAGMRLLKANNSPVLESVSAPATPTLATKGDMTTTVIASDSDDDLGDDGLETVLKKVDLQNEKWSGRFLSNNNYIEHILSEHGLICMKLDGDTPIQDRQPMIDEFNVNGGFDAFLISSGSGAQGVNLVSASRVVIFDVGWNPSHDEQAIARAFRYGQKRKVFVYRLQTYGTWEQKLYMKNVHKLGLSHRVVDKKHMKNAFSKTEMKKYLEKPPPEDSIIPWTNEFTVNTLFGKPDTEDSVLRNVIEKNKDTITNIELQSDLVREEVSDLTEADLEEIKNMILEEERRISGVGRPSTNPTPAPGQGQAPPQTAAQPAALPRATIPPQMVTMPQMAPLQEMTPQQIQAQFLGQSRLQGSSTLQPKALPQSNPSLPTHIQMPPPNPNRQQAQAWVVPPHFPAQAISPNQQWNLQGLGQGQGQGLGVSYPHQYTTTSATNSPAANFSTQHHVASGTRQVLKAGYPSSSIAHQPASHASADYPQQVYAYLVNAAAQMHVNQSGGVAPSASTGSPSGGNPSAHELPNANDQRPVSVNDSAGSKSTGSSSESVSPPGTV
ncbi:hypothetical protein BGW38_010533 [Lunasporangiospora selenospora]|uniref:SNF2 family N-terminal domain-containing protein n=1 Tax=Lunasporangiospora selenospora TaxID=979761 RepID=A0A9P6KIP1_9FUNG|nr:hypothetical protein BGW38_010533 [Lunasporangiospora selenospora]